MTVKNIRKEEFMRLKDRILSCKGKKNGKKSQNFSDKSQKFKI